MDLGPVLLGILKDLGVLALLAVFLATGQLWTKGQVTLVLRDKNGQITAKDKEIEYWRSRAIQLLQLSEELISVDDGQT